MNKSRIKGKKYERKIAEILTQRLHTKFKPSPSSGSIGTNAGIAGLQGDIIRADLKPIIYIECKKYKDFRLENFLLQKGNEWEWVKQTLNNLKNQPDRYWCIVFQKDYGRTHWCITNYTDISTLPLYALELKNGERYVLLDFELALADKGFRSLFGEDDG